MVKALVILEDKSGKTIGVRLQDEITGEIRDYSTGTLQQEKFRLKLSNAIIDSNGFVRAKQGYAKLSRTIFEVVGTKPQVLATGREVEEDTRPMADAQMDRARADKLLFVEKEHSYDSTWLSKDMENMGYMFDLCSKFAKEYVGFDIDKRKFINVFMRSKIRATMEWGHPRLLSQSARDSFQMFYKVDLNGNMEFLRFEGNPDDNEYAHKQLYWVGWIYVYIHHMADIPFAQLVDMLPVDYMIQQYGAGHTMDKGVFYNKIKKRLGK